MRSGTPPVFEPMLASTGVVPTQSHRWAYEPKWDGYRAIAYVDEGLRILSRRGHSIARSFPELAPLPHALKGHHVVLDGELVAGGAEGLDFYALAGRLGASRPETVERVRRRSPATLVVFDVLWLDGRSTAALPYAERRRLLEDLDVNGPAWATTPSWVDVGEDLLAACEQLGLEGLVAKRLDSLYRPGVRSRHWVKQKCAGWVADHAPRRRPRGFVAHQ